MQAINIKNTITLNQAYKNSGLIRGLSIKPGKRKRIQDLLRVNPKLKSKNPVRLLGEEVIAFNVVANERSPVNMLKPNSSPPKSHSCAGKDKKVKENNVKKVDETKQLGTKIKTEWKSTIPQMKCKKNPPELSQEPFKKPQSCLGMQILKSVQVFHALGIKGDQKPGFSSFRVLNNSRKPKGF